MTSFTTPAVPRMKVEVWSDIMCPFCYIGKRHYEEALKKSEMEDEVELEWKSFQLDPTIPNQWDKPVNVLEYLAMRKGISMEQSAGMHQHVTQMAQAAGLEYRFDKAVVANSLKAHRVIQMAKSVGKGDQAEEAFFKAYFTEGKNLADEVTLQQIGLIIGLTDVQIQEALNHDEFAYRVQQDIQEADSLGITGVPFFVFNRRYGVSGAQPVAAFMKTLQKAHEEWKAGLDTDNS